MTGEEFRALALSMPLATEGSHMGNADFRVKGKIFATLWPDGETGMVKLKPDQQRGAVNAKPAVFAPVDGAWGVRGATRVCLAKASRRSLLGAMHDAWKNVAPKRLVDEFS